MFLNTFLVSPRICRPRIAPIVSGSRTRCVCCVCAPWTAWRRRSWPLPNTSWTWTRRSSRPVCLTRSRPATSAELSCRPSWSTKSRMRYRHPFMMDNFRVLSTASVFQSKHLLSPLFSLISQEEDEVPDDETVNQMIARSEEEFDQFMVSSPTCLTFIKLTLFVWLLIFLSSSAWISTAVVKRLVTRNANPGWWRRMSCPPGSWRMMQRWKGSPAKKKRRRCSAVAPVKEKKWTTATPSQRNNGWRWMRNHNCFVLNLWL